MAAGLACTKLKLFERRARTTAPLAKRARWRIPYSSCAESRQRQEPGDKLCRSSRLYGLRAQREAPSWMKEQDVRIEPMPLEGAALVQADPFADHRGLFARFFCDGELGALLGTQTIKQINFSSNRRRGTIRGLHYQRTPHADKKFVRCLRGESYHVVVDIRPDSPTYLRWHSVELHADAMNMLFVPEGFAHGFQSLRDDSELMYFVTSSYAVAYQGGLRYDDPVIGIAWPLEVTELSERDATHPLLLTNQSVVAA